MALRPHASELFRSYEGETLMRNIAAIVWAILCLAVAGATVHAGDAEQIKAIDAAIVALDAAFERQDEDAIKQLMTDDHIAVTPYYDEPQSAAQMLASLQQLKIAQTKVAQTDITLLGPNVALRTSIANFEGTFKGKPLPSRMFVTEVVVKRDGKWLERLYQATTLKP